MAICYAITACLLTKLTRTKIRSRNVISDTLDENLEAPKRSKPPRDDRPTTVCYSAAGSRVAEARVILSGFVFRGCLGARTLLVKTVALIFRVASGLNLGKEGHVATCVGDIACRFVSKYNLKDGKRREMLSAAATAGMGVAFDAPIGGVLFSSEEVSYYFPGKTLFRTFFCSVAAAISLKFLDPYGTGKIFQVQHVRE
jgi:chloride channel 3/4/5